MLHPIKQFHQVMDPTKKKEWKIFNEINGKKKKKKKLRGHINKIKSFNLENWPSPFDFFNNTFVTSRQG